MGYLNVFKTKFVDRNYLIYNPSPHIDYVYIYIVNDAHAVIYHPHSIFNGHILLEWNIFNAHILGPQLASPLFNDES